jgi:hypothetical protein
VNNPVSKFAFQVHNLQRYTGGLKGLLGEIGASDDATVARGAAWMHDMGAASLAEVIEAEMCGELVDAMQLKPVKRKLFEKRIASYAADGGGGGGGSGGGGNVTTAFFISYTQRDPQSMLLASELWSEFRILGKQCWLDVKQPRRDMEAMREGVRMCDVFVPVITDNGADAYVSREMCRQEFSWAVEYGKKIVPVSWADDKKKIGAFISSAETHDIGLGALNFCTYDRSGPR